MLYLFEFGDGYFPMTQPVNPYEPPAHGGGPFLPQPSLGEPLSFGGIVSRGFAIAHRTLAGTVLMFLILAPIQMGSAAAGVWMLESGVMEKVQSAPKQGDALPPEFFGLMAFGCGMVIWFGVILFAFPWIWGAFAGRQQDLVAGRESQSLARHGRASWVTMLLLFICFVVFAILAAIPGAIAQKFAAMQVVTPEASIVEEIRMVARHPLVLGGNAVTVILIAGVSIIFNLAAAAHAARRRGFRDAMRQSFSLIAEHTGDVIKLFGIVLLLGLAFVAVNAAGQFLPFTIPFAMATALVASLLSAYLFVVNLGLATSMYDSRRSGVEGR